jgi:hypothetical protein
LAASRSAKFSGKSALRNRSTSCTTLSATHNGVSNVSRSNCVGKLMVGRAVLCPPLERMRRDDGAQGVACLALSAFGGDGLCANAVFMLVSKK